MMHDVAPLLNDHHHQEEDEETSLATRVFQPRRSSPNDVTNSNSNYPPRLDNATGVSNISSSVATRPQMPPTYHSLFSDHNNNA